ncbi:MAG: helix-turn-helix domain-containing protein [Verrucomicrobiota bacterium]
MRSIAGSVGHQNQRCSCFGGTEDDPPGLTVRQAAQAALDRYHELHKETAKNEAQADTNEPSPLLWDIHAAAKRLSVSPMTIRKLIRQRRLACVPNIRKVLISDSVLRKFAESAQ